VSVLEALLKAVFEPGFFSSGPVQTALLVGGGAAVVSGVVGVFTVMRGQAFAGHALADVSSAGGALAYLLGISPLLGFLGMAAVGAGGMELVGVRRLRGRDLTTGVVFGAGLALTALFIYLDTTRTSTAGAAITVMFGSMFALPASTGILAAGVGLVALAAVAALYRPLLLSSLDPELAAVRGAPVAAAGLVQSLAMALAVALSALTVGAILSTALLIGPAATALRLARRPGTAVGLAVLVALATTWLGILLAYDSYDWTPGHSWPVSFFIVTLVMAAYLLADATGASRGRRPGNGLPPTEVGRGLGAGGL
jgi:zinc/manganese transport system permease protein